MPIIDGKRVEHLGDGAYISEDGNGGFILTANHHDPDQATDTVHVGSFEMSALFRFVAATNPPWG